MGNIAFELTGEYAGVVNEGTDEERPRYEGGVLGLPPDGETFDVAQALAEGDGLIVVNPDNNPGLVDALDQQPALQRTQAPADAPTVGYEQHTVQRLRDELAAREIEGVGNRRKAEIVEVLQRHDRLVDLGDGQAAVHAADPDFDIDVLEGGD